MNLNYQDDTEKQFFFLRVNAVGCCAYFYEDYNGELIHGVNKNLALIYFTQLMQLLKFFFYFSIAELIWLLNPRVFICIMNVHDYDP